MKLQLILTLITLAIIQHNVMAQTCSSRDDCKRDECCAVGGHRFAIPTCQKLRQEGEDCRPGNAPNDLVIRFPNNEKIEAKNVYTSLCPCKANLQCNRGKCH